VYFLAVGSGGAGSELMNNLHVCGANGKGKKRSELFTVGINSSSSSVNELNYAR
jgi:hypothetical protein